MRISVIAKTLAPALVLFWATTTCAAPGGTAGGSAPTSGPGTASAVLPSVEILPEQSDLSLTCSGRAFFVRTFINVDTQASAEVTLSAQGAQIERFVDNTGNIGPFDGIFPNYLIPANGGGLPPNTTVKLVIKTYTGQNLSGIISYTSSIMFNCTTGAILNIANAPPNGPEPIPTLSDAALAAMAGVLALLGMLALRRRRARQR